MRINISKNSLIKIEFVFKTWIILSRKVAKHPLINAARVQTSRHLTSRIIWPPFVPETNLSQSLCRECARFKESHYPNYLGHTTFSCVRTPTRSSRIRKVTERWPHLIWRPPRSTCKCLTDHGMRSSLILFTLFLCQTTRHIRRGLKGKNHPPGDGPGSQTTCLRPSQITNPMWNWFRSICLNMFANRLRTLHFL